MLRLKFVLPKRVAMVGTALYVGGENNPTVDFAVYRSSFDAGKSDSRLTGETECQNGLQIRQFFPGSGCGVIIEKEQRTLAVAEPGLQNFVGKSACTLHVGNDMFVIIWEQEPGSGMDIDGESFKWMLECVRSLSYALA
ncbi:MAG: hypothetical protein Q7S95_01950 [bacterium]|nr:hypothetical protein [bacterium]